MYRFETSPDLKTLVVLVHGMQDGWEARTMHIALSNRFKTMDENWTLILDLSGFENAEKAAQKEQKQFAKLVGKQPLRKRLVIYPENPALAEPFVTGINYTVAADFNQAWEHVGGKPRDVRIPPPPDGTRYAANNPLPAQG